MMAIKNNKVKKASVVTNGATEYFFGNFCCVCFSFAIFTERHFDYHINGNISNESGGYSMVKLYKNTLFK
jgi:hypothetical protein